MGSFILPGVVMIKTWGRVLLGDMSKQIQFDSQTFLQSWWDTQVLEIIQEIFWRDQGLG